MDNQTLLVRRLVAAGAVLLVIVLMVVLVKGCVDNRREAALKDYNRSVRALVERSKNEVGKQLFDALSGASGQDQQQVQETISQLTSSAQEQLTQAQRLDPPDAMKEAQGDLELVLSLRRDGVANVADQIQTALGGTAGASRAVDDIAGQMQAFSASEVVYSQRVAPLILKGLKDNGIAASYDGTAGEAVLPYATFLPEGTGLSWLSPDYVAGQLGAATSSSRPTGTPTPGLHGHQLDSVSVNGVDLTTDGSNRLPASPPPTFTVNFTNGGDNDENEREGDRRDHRQRPDAQSAVDRRHHHRRRVRDGERDDETVALDERLVDDQSDRRARPRRGQHRQQHRDVHRAVRVSRRGRPAAARPSRERVRPPRGRARRTYPLQPWTS